MNARDASVISAQVTFVRMLVVFKHTVTLLDKVLDVYIGWNFVSAGTMELLLVAVI
jgi:hypothetical protein